MSSLKVDVSSADIRTPLNTTVNKEIFEKFKRNCKVNGVPMNTLIEIFMNQYNEGNFVLRFGRDKKDIDIDFADEEIENVNELSDNFGEIIDDKA